MDIEKQWVLYHAIILYLGEMRRRWRGNVVVEVWWGWWKKD